MQRWSWSLATARPAWVLVVIGGGCGRGREAAPSAWSSDRKAQCCVRRFCWAVWTASNEISMGFLQAGPFQRAAHTNAHTGLQKDKAANWMGSSERASEIGKRTGKQTDRQTNRAKGRPKRLSLSWRCSTQVCGCSEQRAAPSSAVETQQRQKQQQHYKQIAETTTATAATTTREQKSARWEHCSQIALD